MLAVTSLGAVWAACAPDFGTQSVVDRFAQLSPKVLIAVDGYRFGGRVHDRRQAVSELRAALPTVKHTVLVGSNALPDTVRFTDLAAPARAPEFAPVPFDHPLWILFSSGTTGIPKGIVQGHGGILLEHLKSLGLCLDLHPDDRYFFFSSTSWMAWNYLVGGLLHGSTIVLYEGSPGYPGIDALWGHAARVAATVLGMGSAYVTGCQKAGAADRVRARPARAPHRDPDRIAAAGERVAVAARVSSTSTRGSTRSAAGRTCARPSSAGARCSRSHEGEIACRWLGVKAEAYSPDGRSLVGQVGEFVMTEPMPSMPVMFWNDPDGRRYRGAYFETFPGVWRQGDWVTISPRGTLGRLGPLRRDAEPWRRPDGVRRDLRSRGAPTRGARQPRRRDRGARRGLLHAALRRPRRRAGGRGGAARARSSRAIRSELSPRHVPDAIVVAPAIPRTLTGKKLEVPVKRILAGAAVEDVAASGAVDRPEALDVVRAVRRTAARRHGAPMTA